MKREITYQKALRAFGEDIPVQTLEREFHIVDKLFMREYPGAFLQGRGVYMPWFLGILNYRLGISINVSELDACWEKIQQETDNYWVPFANVHQVLTELKQNSRCLGVISNWDDTARDTLENAGIADYFDYLIISSEIGINKPEPGIFKRALEAADVGPHECIYVGDNYYDDAVGSKKVGMEALIINRFGRLGVEEIKDVPIINDLSRIKNHLV
jgi:putative hydrolase of the HAD superfamily